MKKKERRYSVFSCQPDLPGLLSAENITGPEMVRIAGDLHNRLKHLIASGNIPKARGNLIIVEVARQRAPFLYFRPPIYAIEYASERRSDGDVQFDHLL